MSLNLIDWIIIIIYLAGLIVLSFFLSRGQKNAWDLFATSGSGSMLRGFPGCDGMFPDLSPPVSPDIRSALLLRLPFLIGLPARWFGARIFPCRQVDPVGGTTIGCWRHMAAAY